jgi:hypothetical protein
MAFAAKDDPVAKGAVTYCLDRLSVQVNGAAHLAALRSAIAAARPNFTNLADVLGRHLFPFFYNATQIAAITKHLNDKWFNPATAWWPAFQPIAPIYADGLLQTLNFALAGLALERGQAPKPGRTAKPGQTPKSGRAPKPIDSYWIIGHDQVQMINLVSPQQVTLLIATPIPPEPPSGVWGHLSEVWVTGRRAGSTPLEVNPASPGTPVAPNPQLRVRTFKIQKPPAPPAAQGVPERPAPSPRRR